MPQADLSAYATDTFKTLYNVQFTFEVTYMQRAKLIVEEELFAKHLGLTLEHLEADRVVVRMPYQSYLGEGRVHGGAISALVDVAATACFWSDPSINDNARGATVGFTINYLSLAVAQDLLATASIRRRGGTLCTGDVSIKNDQGEEMATAIVTYKLSR